MEFVYCIDKNFNNQLSASIYSLLNNVDEDINISILHDDPESFIDYKIKFLPFCAICFASSSFDLHISTLSKKSEKSLLHST